MHVDRVVEAAIVDATASHGVNVLSEEIGFVDRGSSLTLVVDPVDGSANAAADVPLSCFAAALADDSMFVLGRDNVAGNGPELGGRRDWRGPVAESLGPPPAVDSLDGGGGVVAPPAGPHPRLVVAHRGAGRAHTNSEHDLSRSNAGVAGLHRCVCRCWQ